MTTSVPSIDFGLMELGSRAQISLSLTNITHLKASWALKGPKDHKNLQVMTSHTMMPLRLRDAVCGCVWTPNDDVR